MEGAGIEGGRGMRDVQEDVAATVIKTEIEERKWRRKRNEKPGRDGIGRTE